MRRRWTSSPRMKTRWRSTSTWMPPASRTEPGSGRRSGDRPARRGVVRRRRRRPPVGGFAVAGRAAQDGPHPGHQLAEPVGLGDVVVGPDLEADHRVDLGALGRDHDDRHRRVGPDGPAHVDARQPGQHEVEEDEVGLDLGEEPERLGAVDGHGHVEALAGQSDHQRVDERLVVLGQEHPGLGGDLEVRLPASRPCSRRHSCPTGVAWPLRLGLPGHAVYSGGFGRTRVKVEPSPSRESTSTRPWWLLATWRTMESPSPVPPVERLRPWSTR